MLWVLSSESDRDLGILNTAWCSRFAHCAGRTQTTALWWQNSTRSGSIAVQATSRVGITRGRGGQQESALRVTFQQLSLAEGRSSIDEYTRDMKALRACFKAHLKNKKKQTKIGFSMVWIRPQVLCKCGD